MTVPKLSALRFLRASEQIPAIVLAMIMAGTLLMGAKKALAEDFPVFRTPVPVATLNQERLFTQSAYARRLLADQPQRARALQAENQQIDRALEAEELALTEQRKSMSPEEFRPLAEAFDKKVSRIRAEQDEKLATLNQAVSQARDQFFKDAVPLVADYMQEQGILFVLREQSVYLAAADGDITDDILALIDGKFAQ